MSPRRDEQTPEGTEGQSQEGQPQEGQPEAPKFDVYQLAPSVAPAPIERKTRATAVETGPFMQWVRAVRDAGVQAKAQAAQNGHKFVGVFHDLAPVPNDEAAKLTRNLRMAAAKLELKRFSVKEYPWTDPNSASEEHPNGIVSDKYVTVRYGVKPEPVRTP